MLFNLYGHYVQQQKALKELQNETKKIKRQGLVVLFKIQTELEYEKKKKRIKGKSMTKS